MSEDYWFKRRRHGYGWQPATRQGWIALAVVLAIVLGGAAVLVVAQPTTWVGPAAYLGVVAVTLAAFVVLTVRKGPAPRWRWGASPDDDPAEDA